MEMSVLTNVCATDWRERSVLNLVCPDAAESLLPTGWQHRDAAAPLRRLQVEGLLPHGLRPAARGVQHRCRRLHAVHLRWVGLALLHAYVSDRALLILDMCTYQTAALAVTVWLCLELSSRSAFDDIHSTVLVHLGATSVRNLCGSSHMTEEMSMKCKFMFPPGDQVLRELPSPGKSGSVFFVSYDERYMIKTMRKVRQDHWDFIRSHSVCFHAHCCTVMQPA